MQNKLITGKNLVVFGASGAGKDTFTNIIVNVFDYFPIRHAGTIKQLIAESYGLSEEELEIKKRQDSELREAHHKMGDTYHIAIKNRLQMIIDGTAFDFKYKSEHQGVIMTDGRSLERQMKPLLDSGFNGIFLTRNNYDNEFKSETHWTDSDHDLDKVLNFIRDNNYYNRAVIVINDKEERTLTPEQNAIAKKCRGFYNISKQSTKENLEKVTKHICDTLIY